ncbi:MAG: chromate efflux transporter [Mucilaginibacter polytrichastri]|nr:chromate efflux transporter [Mucilaginibacter polytrichastri]
MRKHRQLLFLRDVFFYTFTAFGGPQGHIGIMLRDFVQKRNYVTSEELMELNALTQILPGPSSTQTIVGIAWKLGRLRLAILTFLIWILPSAIIMSCAALFYNRFVTKSQFNHILIFVQPIAIGIVLYAAYSFAEKILQNQTVKILAVASAIAALIMRNAYAFPLLIMMGGIISSALESHRDESELRVKLFANVNRRKVAYFIGILLLFALLGTLINRTSPFSLPIRLFENFYRNGILIFGGGQVLVPLMYTEFVDMKHYLSDTQFISGFALQQALPGPTFSFTSYLGTLAMHNQGFGLAGQILGGFLAVIGINLPGLILILFIVPFWEDLKKISRIRNSLSGINAVAVGFMFAAVYLLAKPVVFQPVSVGLIVATFVLMRFTKIKTPVLIVAGVVMGFVF